MSQALRALVALDDYLAMDESSTRRHEYIAGQIVAMTGGSERHNRIAFNIARILADLLEGTPCQVFINDMKLHVEAADTVYYPAVFVRCGGHVATAAKVARDATLIVEVLSVSTAAIDRREKLVAYWKLPGLREYWLVSQHEQRVEVHRRDDAGKRQAVAYTAGDEIAVGWIGGTPIAVGRLYVGTEVA
jgi:Uma2 family endonuclease